MTNATRRQMNVTNANRARPGSRSGMRTCVGCGVAVNVPAPEGELVRLILLSGGAVAVDAAGGGFGRGAHVHPRPDCIAKAALHGLPKAARGAVRLDGEASPLTAKGLASRIRAELERRVAHMLVAAKRAGVLAFGRAAAESAMSRGEAHLVVVACDDGLVNAASFLPGAISAGDAVAWGSAATLANLAGRSASPSDVHLVAVLRPSWARDVKALVHAADMSGGIPSRVAKREPRATVASPSRGHRRIGTSEGQKRGHGLTRNPEQRDFPSRLSAERGA
jgi:predicted RNA-binding protein YlxR (DUF448 family)/ribosomal protein L7Ae-like RNA K-turn-binding protein